jgi:hypothetical protein
LISVVRCYSFREVVLGFIYGGAFLVAVAPPEFGSGEDKESARPCLIRFVVGSV